MSISGAFNTSRSGLAAVEKWSETTSSNIANASRDGYARKELTLATRPNGGVEITGIRREVDSSLQRTHRLEVGRGARQTAIADGLQLYTSQLGKPGDAGSLAGRMSNLQTSFDALANDPSSEALQRGVVENALALTRQLNETQTNLTRANAEVVGGIKSDVTEVNRTLSELAELGAAARREPGATAQRAAIEDEIDRRIDALSQVMDVQVQRGGDSAMVVTTSGGTPLIEGDKVQTIRFEADTGRLMAGDSEITPGVDGARGFTDGRLAGRFELVGEVMPQMQIQLDELARGLIESFSAADASVAPGAPSLFTDAGAGFNPANAEGLAGRIAVNDAVRPDRGGALWRVRDGAGAAVPGAASDSTQPMAFVAALTGNQTFSDAAGLGSSASLGDFANSLLADQQYTRSLAQSESESLAAGIGVIEAARYGLEGVNIDDELQKLLLIEQSYAANATVIKTLTEMMDTLLAAVR